MANRKIIDLVHAKSLSMSNNAAEAGINTTMAIAAMKNGIRSPEWRAYMMQFVEQSSPGVPADPRQLDRLMGTDATKDDPDMDRRRAYLLGNSPCMDTTPLFLPFGVETIDLGIEPSPTPTPPAPPKPWRPQPEPTPPRRRPGKPKK
jgi:hypothetical protein